MFAPDSRVRIHRFSPPLPSLPSARQPSLAQPGRGYLTLSARVNLYVAELEELSDFH